MKKEIKEKIVLGFVRFVSIHFLIFEKGDKWKNCVRSFKISKYTFLNIWKRGSAKELR